MTFSGDESLPQRLSIDGDSFVKKVFWICLSSELLIVLLDALLNYTRWLPSKTLRYIFNVARESSLGTWFSVSQCLLISVSLLLIYFFARRDTEEYSKSKGFVFLSFLFFYLSLDDAAKIHERVAGYIFKHGADQFALLENFPSYTWHLAFGPFFLFAGLYLFYFLWTALPSHRCRKKLIAAMAVLAVAVGIDFLEGIDGLFKGWATSLEVRTYTVSHAFLMVEEFCEMFGFTLIWTMFLEYFFEKFSSYSLIFSKE